MARERRGRGKGSGQSDSSRFLTTYGDVMTLLLAFFVLIYTISSIEMDDFEMLLESLEVFDNTAAADGLLDATDAIVGDDLSETPQDEHIDVFQDDADDADDEAAEDADDPSEEVPDDLAEIREAVQLALEQADVEVGSDFRIDARGLVISIATDDVLFNLGSAEITDEGGDILDIVAGSLDDVDNDIVVEGHTDDLPIRRPDYSNWELSSERALAVLNRFWQRNDLDEPRLSAVAFGEHQPRVPNDSDSNRSLNRRVEIIVVPE